MIGPARFMAAPKMQPTDCPRCDGHGIITVHSGQTPDDYLSENVWCPVCDGTGRAAALTRKEGSDTA